MTTGTTRQRSRVICRGSVRVDAVERQAHHEGAPFADLGGEVECALVSLDDDVARNRQSLARPPTHFLGGEEGVEDPSADALGDATASVLDLHDHALAL